MPTTIASHIPAESATASGSPLPAGRGAGGEVPFRQIRQCPSLPPCPSVSFVLSVVNSYPPCPFVPFVPFVPSVLNPRPRIPAKTATATCDNDMRRKGAKT